MKNLVLLFLLSVSLPVAGQVPATLSYQGILMQTDGITPLPDGEHSIQFAFYTASSGGAALFTRTLNVATVKGLFTCIIGDGSVDNAALPSSLGTQQLYIGLSVDQGAELEPRTRLTSAPYSFAVAPNDSGPGPVPAGGIIMWSGSAAAIPQGYALCDGTNGTPDLRGRFVVGFDASAATTPSNVTTGKQVNYGAIGNTGGSNLHTLSGSEMPQHSHTGTTASSGTHNHSGNTSSDGNHSHTYEWYTGIGGAQPSGNGGDSRQTRGTSSTGSHTHSLNIGDAGSHTHTFTTGTTGSNQSHENRPPYFVLAFIMKK